MKEQPDKFKPLWQGGPRYRGDAVTADSLVLAHFAPKGREHLCDLGCGSGILPLLLLWEQSGMTALGVDVRPRAIREAEENARQNGMEKRFRGVCADWRNVPGSESFDLIVSNPPYFRRGEGGVSPDPERALMRTESATVFELCRAAAEHLAEEGSFCFVHRTERLAEITEALRAAGLFPVRMRTFARSETHEAEIFLCEARRTAAECRWEAPIYQCAADGEETAEYRQLCHWEVK